MTDRTPPHDLDAERALLGAMILRAEPIETATRIVTEADFHRPAHAELYAAITAMHAHGEAVDQLTIRPHTTIDDNEILDLVTAVPSTTNAATYAQRVADTATARLLITAATQIADLGYTTLDVADAVDHARTLIDSVRAGLGTAATATVQSLDDLVAKEDQPEDWVIPDLLARGDRVILVAPEGYGKSVLWRQIAVMCGQGLHPFTIEPIPPIRTLLVDLENPEAIIRRTCKPIVAAAKRQKRDAYQSHAAMLWHQPGGIDIRTRVGYSALDQALGTAKPDLVCLGPLYKLFRNVKGETMEDAALDVCARLDDLRTRHQFALFLEHHAPKGAHGERDMVPFGSSVWQRWPEFGPALSPVDKQSRRSLSWGDWRGPREVRRWPERLDRGTVWPWDAKMPAVAP
jgi:hypothetical protein